MSHKKFDQNYRRFNRFMEQISATPEEKQEEQAEQAILKDDLTNYDFTEHHSLAHLKEEYDKQVAALGQYDHYGKTEEEKDTTVTMDEQVRRYNNLFAKGYIKDIRTLSLPYVVEKSKNGWSLSETEQNLLEECIKNSGSGKFNVARSTLILQAIGLITDYKSDFPEFCKMEPSGGCEICFDGELLSIDIEMVKPDITEKLISDLKGEADSLNVVDSYLLDSFHPDGYGTYNNRSRLRGLQALIAKGLREGVEPEDLQRAEAQIKEILKETGIEK